jgi:double-stranded RNA-binding protein Staufen
MYSMMSGRHMYGPRATPQMAVPSKYNSQGTAISGHPEQIVYQHRPYNYRPRLASGYGPAPYRGGPARRGTPGSPGTLRRMMPSPPTAVTLDANPTAVPSEASVPDAEVTTADSTLTSAAAIDEEQQQPVEQQMANTKEKTPMCLINELARFNKVQHQYCLTDEQGPAHKKTFFVKLKLGDEEFAASGASIKKAQHAAAGVALEQTKYQHPPPKRQSTSTVSSALPTVDGASANSSVTPTVELNALAMKRGELAVYRPFERKITTAPMPQYYTPPFDYRSGYYGQRYRCPRPPHRFYVALKVGEREFIGEGETMQAARHNAASMALKLLHSLPMPTREQPVQVVEAKAVEGGAVTDDGSSAKAVSANELLKSEISLVHEIALKRGYIVEFEIIKESGPPHMRTFVTRCTCGALVTDGEGSSKKLSKKFAAEKMVAELRKLPALPPPPPNVKPKKNVTKPKQSKNLIKNIASLSTVGVNPISRLIQIQQAKKEKEPAFNLISENGAPRCREFVVQVTVGESVCTGVGTNKKLAKRNAAEQMLQMLGYSLTPPPPAKPTLKLSTDGVELPVTSTSASTLVGGGSDKRVTFVDHEPMRAAAAAAVRSPTEMNGNAKSSAADSEEIVQNKGVTVPAVKRVNAPAQVVPCPVRSLDQLMYLAKIMGFEVQVTNFPKDNTKTEFLSMVTLCTSPVQFYNGCGLTVDAAVDVAAMAAMRKLSEVGLSVGCNPAPSGQLVNRSTRLKSDKPVISTVVSVKKDLK